MFIFCAMLPFLLAIAPVQPQPLPLITPMTGRLSAERPELVYQVDLKEPSHLYIQVKTESKVEGTLFDSNNRVVTFNGQSMTMANLPKGNLIFNNLAFTSGRLYPEKRLQRGRYYFKVRLYQGELGGEVKIDAQTTAPSVYELGNDYRFGVYQSATLAKSTEIYRLRLSDAQTLKIEILTGSQQCLHVGVLTDMAVYTKPERESGTSELRPFESTKPGKSHSVFIENKCEELTAYTLMLSTKSNERPPSSPIPPSF